MKTKLKIYNCEQQSDEWFNLRLGKVTGSCFSNVLNKKTGRRTYMYQLLGEKLSGEPASTYSNKAMENGSECEPAARQYYERLFGKVVVVGFVQLNDFVGCSPDGLIRENGIIEIKCPYPSTHLSYITKNQLPTVYRPQVQGNLWITDREWCDFVSFCPKVKARPFWKIRIPRDDKYIKALILEVDNFIDEMQVLEKNIVGKNRF